MPIIIMGNWEVGANIRKTILRILLETFKVVSPAIYSLILVALIECYPPHTMACDDFRVFILGSVACPV